MCVCVCVCVCVYVCVCVSIGTLVGETLPVCPLHAPPARTPCTHPLRTPRVRIE